MRILPAIDIIDGKCVRLTQGDYAQKKIYNENPVEIAKSFENTGLRYLHLVDLDGAKAGKVINWKTIEAIASQTSLQIDFGGGIKTDAEIERLFDVGIRQVNLGSIAVKEKATVFNWLKKFSAEKIILSADVNNEMIAIHGWQDNSGILITSFMQEYLDHGIKYVACTDIQTDGMLTGPSIALYKKLLQKFPTIKLVASGGVSSLNDLKELKLAGLEGAIVGKALYEGKISLDQLAGL